MFALSVWRLAIQATASMLATGFSNLELITVRDIGFISFRKAIRSLSCLQVEIKVPSLVILRKQKTWLHLEKKDVEMKLREFDPSRHLDSEEAIAMYLEETLQEDPSMLSSALGDIARARGMTSLAKETGLARESLYQALSETGNPTYTTLTKVLDAFGVRFSITPKADSVSS